MNPINNISRWQDEASQIRQRLHQYPELGFEEVQTSKLVIEYLRQWGIEDIHTGFAKTGVVAVIEGRKGPGPAIGLRADMDALPIVEANTFAHISTIPGKMHACGHDGHTTMLLMAARYLAETRNFFGKAVLIFQPAEEGLGGAQYMINDGLLQRFPLQAIFAIHNLPGLAAGRFALRPGAIMASADRFQIMVNGKGGHAAFPHLSKDPLLVATHIYQGIQALVSRTFDPREPVVISVTQIHCGQTSNVIEDQAYLNGTFRCFSTATRDQVIHRLQTMIPRLAQAFEMTANLELDAMAYPPTINTPAETQYAESVAHSLALTPGVESNCAPLPGAEDFSFFLEKVPGCYAFIGNGAGDNPFAAGLHNNRYEFNDTIIPIGAAYLAKLVEDRII